MANIFHEDFRDFLNALNKAEVKYILVGGYSVVLHGYSRTTGDMDLWVERTSENYTRIIKAFHIFGMPLFDMTESNFLSHPIWDVFTFGTPPVAIDIMVKIEGLNFEDVFQKAIYFEDDDLKIRTINRNDLIAAKKIAGRAKDINDLENLE
jgi:predicted nucleotidyltransferase